MANSQNPKFELPECGMFFGSSVYVSFKDYTMGLGKLFTCWVSEDFPPEWYVDRTVEEKLGNLVQIWPNGPHSQLKASAWWRGMFKDGVKIPEPDWKNMKYITPEDWPEIAKNAHREGEGMMDFIRYAADRGLYTMCIYCKNVMPEYTHKLKDFGKWYIGDDCGEIFTFRFNDTLTGTDVAQKRTLNQLSEGYVNHMREFLDSRRAAGWGWQISTSGSYALDYEIIAGLDIPLFEDFNNNFASALCRGLTKQFNLPAWGTHMNHEWYCWLPESSKYRFESFRNGMYQKYMSGSKILVNESGGWYLQSNLCQDSPMMHMPKIHNPPGLNNDFAKSALYVEEARAKYDTVNYNCDEAKRYRRELADFYKFLLANPCPKGQPETRIALVKGNLDLLGPGTPNSAVGSAYDMAEENPDWFYGTPEKGWNAVERVFFPHNNVTGEYFNLNVSGTPYGPVDVITFAKLPSVDFLLENYSVLIFSGWNTCSEEQYALLEEYVRRGGKIFLSIAHLSTDNTRKVESFTVDDLVRKGDFSQLCGCKVKGKGDRFYWAVPSSPEMDAEFEFQYPRRFGIIAKCLGNVEFTDKVDVMLCDDEDFRPLMFRHKYGEGEVYFLNAWTYPGSMMEDFGPSGELHSPSLIGYIYKHLANRCRSTVYITDDGKLPKRECEYIMFSYFPEDGTVCLMNVDFDNSHSFYLHLPGETRKITLAPSEFQHFKLG